MPAETIHECGCGPCTRDEAHPGREYHRHMNLLLSRLDEQQRRWFLAVGATRFAEIMNGALPRSSEGSRDRAGVKILPWITYCPMWGAAHLPSPHPCGESGNSAPPRKRRDRPHWQCATRSGEKTGSPAEPAGAASGSRLAMGSQPERAPQTFAVERMFEPSSRKTGRRWERLHGNAMRHRPAQKGKALGISGSITDWSFAHSNPADSAALQLAQDGQQERGNHPGTLRGSPRSRRQPMYEAGVVGMVQEANALGNARDMPTWITMDGLKKCK
jgi:hypothetical protein